MELPGRPTVPDNLGLKFVKWIAVWQSIFFNHGFDLSQKVTSFYAYFRRQQYQA